MNTAKVCLFGGALLGAGLSSGAQADITINGALDVLESYHSGYGSGYDKIGLGSGYGYGYYSYNNGLVGFDTFDFTVLESGMVTFDALSYWSFNTFFDTQIMIFLNDGNVLNEDNYIDGNDDYGYLNLGSINDTNGSISGLDSFLQTFLDAGDYTIVMGGYYYDIDEVASGAGESTVYSSDYFSIPDSGEYQLDIIGNVRPTVPAPGAFALLGMTGLAASRRRR